MFVFLAAVFAVGFVIFGVGSSVPGGVADVLRGGGTGGPSVSDARKNAEKRPDDPAAQREYARALQQDGQTDAAIAPLERYTRLRPADVDALRELAGLYLAKAGQLRDRAAAAQADTQAANPGSDFLPPPSSPLGQALARRPVADALAGRTNERFNRAYTAMQAAFADAKRAYGRIAARQPEDPTVQIQLADAALNSGDTATALAAYKRFLKLAPEDPSASLVREQVKQLQGAAAGQPAPGG